MIKYSHKKERATMLTLRIDKPVQEYALAFLHIVNNAKEYPDTIYDIKNNYGNDIYVTFKTSEKKIVYSYLEQFGDIVNEEEVNRFIIYADFDKQGWDEFYGDEDIDEVQFVVDIE